MKNINMVNRTIKIADKAINFVMIVFFLLLISIGGYAIYDSYRVYTDVELKDEVRNLRPKIEDGFSIAPLQEINPDVEAWIRIFDTQIDYPILHSRNNMDYLNIDYNGDYTPGGSIFTDYRNTRDFADDYTITYGHNMVTGQMYSDIKKYEDKNYFDNHLRGILYTRDKIYQLEVIYFALMNAYNDEVYNLMFYRNGRNVEVLADFEGRAFNKNNAEMDGEEKLLLLSTCDAFGSNDRSVILAKMIEVEEDEAYEIEQDAMSVRTVGWDSEGENEVEKTGKKIVRWFVVILIMILVAVIIRKICKKQREQKRLKKRCFRNTDSEERA